MVRGDAHWAGWFHLQESLMIKFSGELYSLLRKVIMKNDESIILFAPNDLRYLMNKNWSTTQKESTN